MRIFLLINLKMHLPSVCRCLGTKKTNVFRIFNGEGDGVGGLTIDYYDANILINYYSEGIISYRKQIIEALKRTAEFATITEKNRSQKLVETESSKRGDFVVLENGVKCRVNLESGGMTGIFMDQREVRQAIRRNYAKNRNVLNLFSYSALFSVFAVLGGAKSTTNVDIARRSHEIAEANYALNGISAASHKFITEDVFEFLIRAAKQNRKYDLIIIDPPSFSTSNGVAFSTEKELGKLIDAALAVSSKNAALVISTNNSKISKEQFSKLVGKRIKIREEFSLPADYRANRDLPESSYLKVAIGTPL